MFRRRVRSALYIDFENVPLPPETIASWLAWLEDGVFDPKRERRRFIQKRVYWNANAEKHKETFRRHGFATILVGKYSGLKNGADIRMAMDLIEATYRRSEIDEYILLSGDSDFVPVLERLREKAKRTAMVATEHRPHIHTIYNQHADLIIPSRRLVEAAQYRRPPRTLLGRLMAARRQRQSAPPSSRDGVTISAPHRPARLAKPAVTLPSMNGAGGTTDAERLTPIGLAEARVLALVMAKPRNYVAQKRVLADLERIPGFKRAGSDAYLGFATYKGLMKELSRRNPMIKVVDQVGGGTGIIHVPKIADASPEAAGVAAALNGHAVTPVQNRALTSTGLTEARGPEASRAGRQNRTSPTGQTSTQVALDDRREEPLPVPPLMPSGPQT